MNKPSAPMLYEFELISGARIENEGDLDILADKICDLFTDDVRLEDTSTTDVVTGRAELHEYCKALFGPYSDVRIEAKEVIDADHVSTMLIEISGTHTGELYGYAPSGKRVSFPAVAIYRTNEDNTKVRHETLSYDTNFIINQITGG
ncbi:MAG: hypothetical protein EOP24_46310 [Hyphomicrobiales bacterium]|nr:MAG: hypothetical protein EOP24_46310 [Hyphomicrobiales bacterium]